MNDSTRQRRSSPLSHHHFLFQKMLPYSCTRAFISTCSPFSAPSCNATIFPSSINTCSFLAPCPPRTSTIRHSTTSFPSVLSIRCAKGDEIKFIADDQSQDENMELIAKAIALPVLEKATILTEALPYINQFAGKTFVIKYGGAAMINPQLKSFVIKDLVFLACIGIRPIFVHGGGPEINSWLTKVGIEPKFENGIRVTDQDTMDIVEMVLAGRVNKELVSLIQQQGGKAVGLCGKDAKLISAKTKNPKLGYVGDIEHVDPTILQILANNHYIPVISSIGTDDQGNSYNINADTLAGEIAAAIKAEKLIMLTDVPGVMKDPKDKASLYSTLTKTQIQDLIGEGIISGGMIPKVQNCVQALDAGVNSVHILDGRLPHSILLEVFSKEGAGTMMTK